MNNIKIVITETAELNPRSFLKYCISIDFCLTAGVLPSLYTLNSFLAIGTDDSTDGREISWEPFALSQEDYDYMFTSISSIGSNIIDQSKVDWPVWFNELKERYT